VTFAYLGALLFSLLGMGLIDFRQKLALFAHPIRTTISVATTVILLLAVDLVGIALGIFFRGQTTLLSGILIAPELPLEELFFLTLLCYTTLVSYLWFKKGGER
jgi:lycopene cyclase domain-containing protein